MTAEAPSDLVAVRAQGRAQDVLLQAGDAERPRQQEALGLIDLQGSQLIELFEGLDALGEGVHAEVVGSWTSVRTRAFDSVVAPIACVKLRSILMPSTAKRCR